MKKIFTLIIFTCLFITSNADVLKDMKLLVNYNRMTEKHKQNYIKQRSDELQSIRKHNIPSNFQIPIQLQSYRGNYSTKYYGIYNHAYGTGVGYIPTNLVRYYEEEAWFAFCKYGNNAPSLSIILAQQFTESAFNPYAIGDNNKSYGLPQLHRSTAQYLYRQDKRTWQKIFYFDKNGQHHFKSIRTMIQFPFLFLIKEKRYSSKNKFHGIRRYNGSGDNAIRYAEKVIKRSLFYEELFAKYNEVPLDTQNFKKNLFGMINLSLENKGCERLSNKKLNQIFKNMVLNFSEGYVNKTYNNNYHLNSKENKALQVNNLTNVKIPNNSKDYYLIVEDGNTLYSYFKNSKNMLYALNNRKNNNFYVYYLYKKRKIKAMNYNDLEGKNIFTNVVPGNKIYIPPGITIYKPNTDFAVIIK